MSGEQPWTVVFNGENLGRIIRVEREHPVVWNLDGHTKEFAIYSALAAWRPLVTVICDRRSCTFRSAVIDVDSETRVIAIMVGSQ